MHHTTNNLCLVAGTGRDTHTHKVDKKMLKTVINTSRNIINSRDVWGGGGGHFAYCPSYIEVCTKLPLK